MNFSTHNPDVLDCIANLSNDEVFTPPQLAESMLDHLATSWSAENNGEIIWQNPNVTFLDPATKSGVFLREITRRLIDGLQDEIPDLQARVNHILTKQVFGIAITELTGLLARRSVYCSKQANNKHSVCTNFENKQGHIWFKRTEHTWVGGKPEHRVHPTTGENITLYINRRCSYCGTGETDYSRDETFESHAYAFIHTDDIQQRLDEIFGAKVQFDVVIGNPPYQLKSNGGTRDVPIYHHFVRQAKNLKPKKIIMIIQSRWMSAGLGLKDFRDEMLTDSRISDLVDFPNSNDVFPGVDIKGGVCYFLWNSDHNGKCNYSQVRKDSIIPPYKRELNEHDVLVRGKIELDILRKVLSHNEESVQNILSVDKQFGWTSNFSGLSITMNEDSIPVYCIQNNQRQVKFIPINKVTKSKELIDRWKLLVPKAASDGGKKIPDIVLGKPIIASSGTACTQSYLFFMFDSKEEAEFFETYYKSRFFRFLVSLRKTTQDATRSTYKWVPMQSLDVHWKDEMLYHKYGLTDEEIAYIEAVIRPMTEV